MPDHVMSTLRSSCSSPSVCFGSCLVSWDEPTKGSAPTGQGKEWEEVNQWLRWLLTAVQGSSAGKTPRCWLGGGAKDHESIKFPGIYSIALQMHWRVGLIFTMFALYHQFRGFPKELYGQVTLSEGVPCMHPTEILCHCEHDKCSEKSSSKERGELHFDLPFSKPFWWQKSPPWVTYGISSERPLCSVHELNCH